MLGDGDEKTMGRNLLIFFKSLPLLFFRKFNKNISIFHDEILLLLLLCNIMRAYIIIPNVIFINVKKKCNYSVRGGIIRRRARTDIGISPGPSPRIRRRKSGTTWLYYIIPI